MLITEAASLISPEQYWAELDLSYICDKMCSAQYPMPRWQPSLAQTCLILYKRFLWLMHLYPGQPLVPTRDIDEFWHNHILYTENYHRDCQAIFGHYLHHRPSDADDKSEMILLSQQFKKTKQLYQQTYNQPLLVLKRD